ncbi:MAG: DegT/DnrJ/EryC1/StrS family aminotransferase [Candidatus Krumholzibacteriia bacterium]
MAQQSKPTGRRVSRYDLVTPMRPCKDEIMEKFERILMSGNFILGEEVALLERELADACDVPEAVGVASGSSALYVALAMAGVRPGDEVITTPYTFEATIEAIILLGATPVFVDIRPMDLNLDPGLLEHAINERTRVILPVHIFGAPCDMHRIVAVAEAHELDVVVDMAQAFGSMYAGRPCGSYARMSTLSFYPTKNLPGIGDGGMIFCRSTEDAARVRAFRGHKAMRSNGHLYPGWNSRLDEIQAMAIRVRYARFKEEQADRDRVAEIYDAFIPPASRLRTPNGGVGMRSVYHQYWVRTPQRDDLRARLDDAGIDTGIYYDPPLHRQELAEYCRVSGGPGLPEAERAGREVLTLPIHAALAVEDAERIGRLVGDFLRRE